MKEITMNMINTYKLETLGYDFMGYTFNKTRELSFHHLIIPRKNSKKEGIGDGYVWWNGAILVRDTAHDYLHKIEFIKSIILIGLSIIGQITLSILKPLVLFNNSLLTITTNSIGSLDTLV